MARGGAPKMGWYRDPTGRHDLRRWDGDGWSEWVMDGGRRSFDDLDGCGGPPQGEAVAVADEARGHRRRTSTGARHRGGGGSADALLPAGEAASTVLVPALIGVVAAGATASLVVGLGERGLLPAVGPGASEEVVRRFLLPLVVATAVFEVVLAVVASGLRHRGGVVRSSPWRAVLGSGRDELLRGVGAFLLALFARTFLVSALAGPFAGAIRPIGPSWLFVLEAIVLIALAPVVEELVFRGALLRALRHRSRPVVAVLGQAAIYGASLAWLGVGTSRLAAGLGAFAVGAVFGWFVHTVDDLRPVIVGHALLNGWFMAERLLAG